MVIQKDIQQLPGLVQKSEDIPQPAIDQEPLKELSINKDGFKCIFPSAENGQECGYICRVESWMKNHCRQMHEWKSSKTRGGSLKKRTEARTNAIWIGGIWNQRFYEYGPWKQFFQVKKS